VYLFVLWIKNLPASLERSNSKLEPLLWESPCYYKAGIMSCTVMICFIYSASDYSAVSLGNRLLSLPLLQLCLSGM
jgi:hypothetical protein